MQRIESKNMSWDDKMAAFVAIPRKSHEFLMAKAGFDDCEIRDAVHVSLDNDLHKKRLDALATKLRACIVVWSETPNGFIKDGEKACRVGEATHIFGSPGEKPGENLINLVMRDNNHFRFIEILHDDEIRMFVHTAALKIAEQAERLAKQEKRMEEEDRRYAIMDIDCGVFASWAK